MRRLQALCLVACAAVAVAAGGCGEGGAQSGATVSVYVVAPLCEEARREVDDAGRRAGDLKVRVLCQRRVEGGGQADLALAGVAARRATEDSSSVAFLVAPGPAAAFTKTIVETADVAWVETGSAAAPVGRILRALEGSGDSPREAVLDEVG
ncbi:MAG TPA: hypothetical protein VFX35_05045 [Solirubrobacterales bacterium]|nr:hypothetical protein [Solirubrobacterales bacterium]